MFSLTMFRYLAWRLITSVGGLFIAFTLLIMVIDLIENLRFAGKYADGSFLFALQVTILRSLSLTQVLLPFLFLFGGLWCFTQMNRRSEIPVMRSAGLSVWKLLMPGAVVSFFVGVFLIIFVDPLSASMMAKSEKMKNDIRGKRTSIVQFFNDGLWLRQRDSETALIINAKNINQQENILSDVIIWRLNENSELLERIDAPKAFILDNILELHDARLRTPDEIIARKAPIFPLQTSLTVSDLNEQVAKPETISIWNLSRFIRLAEAAGLSTGQYYLRFHDLLSIPIKLIGMILIAAAFSLRPTRMGGTMMLVVYSIGTGFILYILTEVATALGESGTVPLVMAAWSPALIAILFAVTGLLHFEDG